MPAATMPAAATKSVTPAETMAAAESAAATKGRCSAGHGDGNGYR
jgi:hypothetical protein